MAPIKDQSMPLVHTFPMTERIKANTLNFEEKVCSLEKTLNNWKKKKANFNWQNQYCQDIRFVETHILQFVTDRI